MERYSSPGNWLPENFFANIPIGIAIIDLDGRFLHVNETYCSISGYTEQELLETGLKFQQIVCPDGSDDNHDLIHSVLACDISVFNIEKQCLRRDGRRIWVKLSASVQRDKAGNPLKIICLLEDIEDRKVLEESLAERGDFLRSVLETTVEGFLMVNFQGFIISSNTAYCRMSGYTLRELEHKHLNEIDVIETSEITKERLARVVEVGSEFFETMHRRKDGTIFEVEMSVSRVYRNEEIQFIGFCRDISQRRKIERNLRASEQRFRAIYENNPAGIGQVDLGCRLKAANLAFCELLGYTEEELIGRHLRDITHPESIDENLRKQTDLFQGLCDHFEMEKRFIRKDGTEAIGILGANLIRNDSGQPAYAIGTVIDITERNKIQQEKEKLQEQLYQAQKMESVGQLAGGVAHDFNNMLSVILANANMGLEQLDEVHPLHSLFTEILGAAERSADLVRQLLAFARKQTVAPRLIDLNETIAGMLKMLGRIIGENIRLIWKPEERSLPLMIDPSQIDQILANLCVNARDAIRDIGSVTIETKRCSFDDEFCETNSNFKSGDFIMISVSDTGSGMDRQTQMHLFEPFFTTKETGKGTGLGLATVYGIVKQNKGFINVYSEVGEGSIFRIYLPENHSENNQKKDAKSKCSNIAGNETILLVEDEPAILKITKRMLERLGYSVLAVNNPESAIDIVMENSGGINLLMTDVVMPNINGSELASRLQKIVPDLRVLFMSGYTADIIANSGVVDEGVSFIQKPFSKENLGIRLREILERS